MTLAVGSEVRWFLRARTSLDLASSECRPVADCTT
jgi:hypothetical protein